MSPLSLDNHGGTQHAVVRPRLLLTAQYSGCSHHCVGREGCVRGHSIFLLTSSALGEYISFLAQADRMVTYSTNIEMVLAFCEFLIGDG